MGFAAPLALLLLGALTLPWLVHRMRQRDVPTVRLPTIALLQNAMVVTQRRRALQDLLLMLTRMALIALLAFGLAAPFVWGGVVLGDGQPASLVVVIDDSMSMQREERRQPLVMTARERALEVIHQLPESSQVGVIAAGRPPRTLAPLGPPAQAHAALSAYLFSPARGTELAASVELADAMLAAAQHEQRRVLVLSDFKGSGAPITSKTSSVTIDHETFGSTQAVENFGFVDAVARRDPDSTGGFLLHARVRGFHSTRRSVSVRVLIGGNTVHQQDVPLGPDDQANFEMRITPEQAFEQVAAQLELAIDDGLAIDNHRAVLLRDPRTLRLLLVNGDPRPTHSSDELHFLSRALPLHATHASALTIETVDGLGLERTSFDDVDLIWLANVAAPSADVATRLHHFVNAGGSLVITAGDRIDPAAINARLDTLLPGRIESVQAAAGVDFAVNTVDDAPADPWGMAIESIGHAATTRRWVTEPRGHVSLRFADGVPALLQRTVGRGRVLLWATSIDGDWTDLPYRPGFLAFTHGVLDALATAPENAKALEPGHAVRLPMSNDSVEATLIDPSGKQYRLPLDAETVAASADQTFLPGAYAVRVTDRNGVLRALPRAGFVVAPPLDESDLTPMPTPQKPADEKGSASVGARSQRPVDGDLFAWVLPLFLLEALLRVQRRRVLA